MRHDSHDRQGVPGPTPRRARLMVAGRLVLVAALLVSLCPAGVARQQSRYLVGPLDVLGITVWSHPELSGRFPVEADGTLAFPLAGRIPVAGRSLLEVEDEIRKRLNERYVKNPVVTATVEDYQSQKIFVAGEVQKPGSYALTRSTTLLEALAQAGSTNQYAGTEALILRLPAAVSREPVAPDGVRAANAAIPSSTPAIPGQAPGQEVIRLDLDRLQHGDLASNVSLQAGDTIFVPRGETVFVFGFANKPGEYVLRKGGTTVLQVLALAGGASEQGSTSRLKISRQMDGRVQEIKASLNDVVKPGDTIIVGQRVF